MDDAGEEVLEEAADIVESLDAGWREWCDDASEACAEWSEEEEGEGEGGSCNEVSEERLDGNGSDVDDAEEDAVDEEDDDDDDEDNDDAAEDDDDEDDDDTVDDAAADDDDDEDDDEDGGCDRCGVDGGGRGTLGFGSSGAFRAMQSTQARAPRRRRADALVNEAGKNDSDNETKKTILK